MEHRTSQVERDGVVYRVEGRPLPPLTFHGGLRETRLARPSADVRIVVPGVQSWALGLLFLLMAAGAGSVAWNLLQAGNPGWVPVVIVVLGGAFAVVTRVAGLNMLTDRTRFDRAAGRASRKRLGRAVWTVDLSELLAVQCLYTGQQWIKSGWVRQYQINLVLRAADDRRVQVCGDSHPDWVLALGGDLAEFLGVPVIDQTWSPGPEPVEVDG
jgi:hypothetical protein